MMRLGQRFFTRLQLYIPAEDSLLAAMILGFVSVVTWGKYLGVILGTGMILRAFQIVDAAYPEISPSVMTGLKTCFSYFFSFFMELLSMSLMYLWQPVLIYLAIALATRSWLWRKFWCLVGVSGWLLHFAATIQESAWKEYRLLPLLLVQGYLFLLWLLPREAWNFFGLLVSSALGFFILILPDLPTAFDDFGMFSAVLLFFLGYVHLVASLTQRLVSRI